MLLSEIVRGLRCYVYSHVVNGIGSCAVSFEDLGLLVFDIGECYDLWSVLPWHPRIIHCLCPKELVT